MRLIDADALIAETMKNRCADCDKRKGIKQGKTTFVYDFGEAPCRACDVGDMIDTLDEATTIGGWISVKDRLPEKDGLYLVYGMSEAMRELLPDCVPIWLCYWRRKYEGWYDIEMCRGYDFITHWMPLPEPPKE